MYHQQKEVSSNVEIDAPMQLTMIHLLSNLQSFFKSEWKRLLTIFLMYTPTYLILMLVSTRQGPDYMETLYGKPNEWFWRGLQNVVEVTIIYYVLIFRIALPFLQTKKVKRFLFQLSAFLVLLFVYEYIYNFILISPSVRAGVRLADFLTWHVGVDIIILCIGAAVSLLIEWNAKSKRQEELERQKLDAELSAIKYQINPHFLFNSLSFIYSKTIPLNEEVAHAVLLLSDIMRYALGRDEDGQGKVDLMKEITHMRNVLEINQMRYEYTLHIQYQENISHTPIRIPPLVLITLVENAFKHGDLSDAENPLAIRLEADNKHLHFYCCNKKKKGSKELSNGIGLNNVRQRLELMYGVRHSFHIKEDEKYYITNLHIDL
ncbi:histidine kinase [Rhodocytophaga aerolata]|uniref:Histidine kinase n=1 Tax=Rhodocytophaga aerolata TaxID=455078 RepID=A0ABT8RBV0_9BACT|nr:histidine kinase [Rhodocytophaga aerolata]MDO1448180.1 histidine kinase [Rhodocytophaga aerolata]